MSLTSVC